MKNRQFYIILIFAINTMFAQQHYHKSVKLMGSDFKITVVANTAVEGQNYIACAIDEISRIERLISSWNVDSQTTLINKNSGIKPVVVSNELYQLIERAKQISKISNGTFDISYASMDKIWKFDGSVTTLPSPEKIKASIAKVGYNNILLNPEKRTVFLTKKGMKIGFGGIGKGYAADKAKDVLIKKGVKSGIINAAGDLTTWGMQKNGTPWQVGIKNPLNKDIIFAWFPMHNDAVVTSGNYEKYIMINGERYTHIINPKTGYPSKGISSVSVFAPKAELADALATSLFVMGREKALEFINQLPKIECIIVTDTGKIYYSNNIEHDKK